MTVVHCDLVTFRNVVETFLLLITEMFLFIVIIVHLVRLNLHCNGN